MPINVVDSEDLSFLKESPAAIAHGDSDDHLAICTTLAGWYQRHSREADRDAIIICRAPTSTWRHRFEALKILLTTSSQMPATLVDIDGLYQGAMTPDQQWNDADSRRQRHQIFDVLTSPDIAAQLMFLRTAAQPEVTIHLEARGACFPEGAGSPTDVNELEYQLSALPHEIRECARWLVRKGHLGRADLRRLIDAAGRADDAPTDDILAVVYDHLPPSARRMAQVLSTERSELSVNGSLGPFSWRRSQTQAPITRSALRDLKQCGFVQHRNDGSGVKLKIPRLVRRFLIAQAMLAHPEEITSHHEQRARAGAGVALTSDWHALDVHYHAVRSGDIDLAADTGLHYGADLRDLGYRLSIGEFGSDLPPHERFAKAARAYQVIVERFDSEDAYAWEYVGYNLLRSLPSRRQDPDIMERARSAYARAHQLAPNNPLYHGRLIGLRARLGQQVVNEFGVAITRYRDRYQDRGVSYFAEAAPRGLKRDPMQLQAIHKAWRSQLARFDNLRSLLPH